MTAPNTKGLGVGTILSILAIVIVVAGATGAVLGKFGEQWGLSAGMRVVLGFLFVGAVSKGLIGLRLAALRQPDRR